MQNKINNIFQALESAFPNGGDGAELKYSNPYQLLVATMLSAQATDKGVNKATKELFEIVKTPEEMLKLGEEKLKTYIKSINYFNNKAKYIIQTSKQLVDNFNSKVPDTMEELTSLAGVGRKTASCVLIYAFKKKAVAVDTHVFRVSNRLGVVNEKDVLSTEKRLLKIVPDRYILQVNRNLVYLGRYICKAKNPDCNNCPLTKYCNYFKQNNKTK